MISRTDDSPVIAVVPGVPVAKGRPRADTRPGKAPRFFLAPRERNWKSHAQACMADAHAEITEGPVAVRILAFWARPKSWAKKRGGEAECRVSRPDADRIASGVLDAGTGVWWVDDAQVVRLVVEKWYCRRGDGPCVVVEMDVLGGADGVDDE